MASFTTPIPPTDAGWTPCGECMHGSIAPRGVATRHKARGGAVTTNTLDDRRRRTRSREDGGRARLRGHAGLCAHGAMDSRRGQGGDDALVFGCAARDVPGRHGADVRADEPFSFGALVETLFATPSTPLTGEADGGSTAGSTS